MTKKSYFIGFALSLAVVLGGFGVSALAGGSRGEPSYAGPRIESGAVTQGGDALNCTNNCSVEVKFKTPYSSIPRVVVQPQWQKLTGDEGMDWWVPKVTQNGFTIAWHTPEGGTRYGDFYMMWVAVEQK